MSELLIGWSEIDVTPQGKVDLYGQYYHRVSQGIHSPLTATALVMQSGTGEQAVLITLDLVGIRSDFQDDLRAMIKPVLPELDVTKIFINVNHTHSAPCVNSFPAIAWLSELSGVISIAEYRKFLLEKIKLALLDAWKNRKPGGISHALSNARVGHCRRAVYTNGTAEMYGQTNREDFTALEGGEDSGVDLLFTFDAQRKPTGLILNLACPAQIMEATYQISSDFAGEIKRLLQQDFGDQFHMLVQISAAGCQAPRDLTRAYQGEPDFWHADGVTEIGRRLKAAVENVIEQAATKIDFSPVLKHEVKTISLPRRRATYQDYVNAKNEVKRLEAIQSELDAYRAFCDEVSRNEKIPNRPGPYDSKLHHFVLIQNNKAVVARYLDQDKKPTLEFEMHAMRLGNTVTVTNPFELYLDFGHQIKARSRATQTFIVELCSGIGGYLPSARAEQLGGYGGLIINGEVGSDGGKKLVDLTLEQIDSLWK